MNSQEEQDSIVSINPSEAFPKKQTNKDYDDLQIPFPELLGEYVEFLGKAADATIALSNFRLLIRFEDSFVNVPIRMIESVECRDIFYLYIFCKDGRSFRCTFSTNEQCQEWYKRLGNVTSPLSKIEDLFAFAFHAWCFDAIHCQPDIDCSTEMYSFFVSPGGFRYNFDLERERLGFHLSGCWRICTLNEDFTFCPTYPKKIIVPAWISDKQLTSIANFRSSKRIPAVVWRHPHNSSVIARCSQPEVGWLGWRNSDDETYLHMLAITCAIDQKSTLSGEKTPALINGNPAITGGDDSDDDNSMLTVPHICEDDPIQTQAKKVLIIDARSYTAAVANRAKGGGCECAEYYPNCEIQFMNLANIHAIRKSFQSVRSLCAISPDQSSWLSALENTKWLQYISFLLKSTLTVVSAIEKEKRPVLVHCSDGWDRTPQIVALAELLLDPYYRTIEGFQVLVEREWLDYGHKFADRCGHSVNNDDINERCPVFLQWLDCVHQLLKQFPCAFEFNETFLVKLVHHTFSSLFGTFLCNSAMERHNCSIADRTCSVWSFVQVYKHQYCNLLYSPQDEQLQEKCRKQQLPLHIAFVDLTKAFDTVSRSGLYMVLKRIGCPPTLHQLVVSFHEDMKASVQFDGLTSDSFDIRSEVLWPSCHMRNLHLWTNMFMFNSAPASPDDNLHMQISSNAIDNITAKVLKRHRTRSCDDIHEAMNKDDDSRAVNAEHQTSGLVRTSSDPNLREHVHDSGLMNDNQIGNSVTKLTQSSEGTTESLVTAPETLTDEFTSTDSENGNSDSAEVVENGVISSADEEDLSNGVNGGDITCNGTYNGFKESSEDEESTELQPLKNSSPVIKMVETLQVNGTSGEEIVRDNNVSPNAMESSTETLTGDSGCKINGEIVTKYVEKDTNENSKEDGQSDQLGLELVKTSTVSTSTTDISDSCIDLKNPNLHEPASHGHLEHRHIPQPLNLHTSTNDTSNGCVNSNYMNGNNTSPTNSSEYTTPNLSPRVEILKKGDFGCAISSPYPRLDADGLTSLPDSVQERLFEIEQKYRRELGYLRRELHMTKLAFQNNKLPGLNGETKEETISLPDSVVSGEHPPQSNCSSLMSDLSWEKVEERDTQVTLWVPDHAANRCFNCDALFYMLQRKHHCRNCGHIFCAKCSDYKTPIPKEQLFDPVRVCCTCFDQLQAEQLKKLAEMEHDQPIAAGAK